MMGSRPRSLVCLLLIVTFIGHTVSETKCRRNEILTITKGCVDREGYLERVLMRSWVADDLDKAKKDAGMGRHELCKKDETLTATGCVLQTETPHHVKVRAPISPGKLPSELAVRAGGGALAPRSVPADHELTQSGQPKAIGHNRPRHNVILPGRRLVSGRKCRPYEVLASDNRCIAKLKPKAIYKHQDHKYGLQRRHRHPRKS